MRSLFTEDIPGAQPTCHAYDKSTYYHRHQLQVAKFGPKNPEHVRVIEWYSPPKRFVEPVDREDFAIKPRRLSREHSYSIENNSKNTPQMNKKKIEQTLTKSSIFAGVATESLKEGEHHEPYFPHRYNEPGMKSKWSGDRSWHDQNAVTIVIPKVTSQYFPKWG